MLILRSLIFSLGQWLFTPIFSVLALLTFPFSRIRRNIIISIWARSMLWWLSITCNIRYEIKGVQNIPATPCVILSKHQSAWETLAFQLIFPPQVYVMKRELLWIPFFGWGLAMTSPIAIQRSAGREALKQLVRLGQQRLAQGFWVVVFPEGTRIAPGKQSKFHIGGAWLASGAKATVLPVTHNAGLHWAKNSWLKKPGMITVSIGQPIDCTHLKPEAVNSQVETWINTETAALHQPQ